MSSSINANYIHAVEKPLRYSARNFARCAIQAKAKPSLRTGAGGVGGLVAVSVDGDFYFPGYDNNGNVIGYWNEDGEIVAEYAYDAVGRPVERDADAVAYNPRGEVTNAVVGGDAFRYAYDHIGNRQSANEDGTTTAYSANGVNQYTAVGSAQPSYDADGNLVDDGMRTFEWSASGHLAEAATPSRWLWADYDHLGRRTFRATDRRSGFSWLLSDEREFVYDGWNLIHEHRYDYQDDSDTDIEYFWGPDLSGSLQGAGGVGGLVAVSVDGDFYFPGYDNNGNVIGYWNESGSIVAEYAYDAFGNTISSSGSMASVFPHRFSTKYYDTETDLYYYGYRYYAPSLGRWISRDPLEEDSWNLYEFCRNAPSHFYDPHGMSSEPSETTTHKQHIPVRYELWYIRKKKVCGKTFRWKNPGYNGRTKPFFGKRSLFRCDFWGRWRAKHSSRQWNSCFSNHA